MIPMKYEIKNKTIIFNETNQFQTVEDFLDHYKQSKKNKYLLIQNKELVLGNQSVKDIHERINDLPITLHLQTNEVDWTPSEEPCEVLYQDPFILVVHKQAGIIIHGEENDTHCLNAKVSKYLIDHDIHTTVRPLHRLDKDTTGIVLYSLIPFFQPWLDTCMEQKKIHREYLAIVYGNKKVGEKFDIHKSIGRDRHHSNQYRISKSGKNALTHCEVIQRYHEYNLIRCILDTGRTHQIRVHLSSIGLPIVNDPIYGKYSKDFKNMGLWAKKISFKDPISEKKHEISEKYLKDYSIFDIQ